MAIDAAARVPAAAGQLVVDLDREHVRRANLGVRGEVAFERGIAVGTGAYLRAVHVHGAVHVHAIELDHDPLSRGRSREVEGLSVPAQATVEVPAFIGSRRALVEWQRDAPIMGHVQGSPGRIVEGRVLRAADVAEMELPGKVEADRGRSLSVVGIDQRAGYRPLAAGTNPPRAISSRSAAGLPAGCCAPHSGAALAACRRATHAGRSAGCHAACSLAGLAAESRPTSCVASLTARSAAAFATRPGHTARPGRSPIRSATASPSPTACRVSAASARAAIARRSSGAGGAGASTCMSGFGRALGPARCQD